MRNVAIHTRPFGGFSGRTTWVVLTVVIAGSALVAQGAAIGTAVTYQGELVDNDVPVTDACDFEFTLWDDPAAGTQTGGVVAQTIDVENGSFTTLLDFGAGVFTGEARWLQIDVCCPSPCSPALTPLDPRQELTPAPYALRASSGIGPPQAVEYDSVTGHVGIGTDMPQRRLHIKGGQIRVDQDGGSPSVMLVREDAGDVWKSFMIMNQAFGPGNGDLRIDDLGQNVSGSGATRFIIKSNGRVGINNPSPTETLSVGGTIESTTGGFKFPDGTVLQTATYAGAVPPPEAIELLHWPPQVATYAAGDGPYAVAFDGTNIWVTNYNSDAVAKLRASDGANLGTFAAGDAPWGLAFDGANIWVANSFSDDVTKLRASDGANLGKFAAGDGPNSVAFDGANIWVANYSGDDVTKLRASDGANLGIFAAGDGPVAVAFDGANIWVANILSGDVTKLRASDGANLGTFAAGASPRGIAFDGTNIWIANSDSDDVTKLRASDGANLGTFAAGDGPNGIAFDGANIWVANFLSGGVTKLRASDGANLGTFAAGDEPLSITFDGANIWVANANSDDVTKFPADSQTNQFGGRANLTGGSEADITDETGFLVIGSESGSNLVFDTNEIQARFNGSVSTLLLNPHGGSVIINGDTGIDGNTIKVDATTHRVGLGTGSPSERLHVVGNIVYTGTISDISDRRLKENIAPVENATAKIHQLRGVYFNMTDTPGERDVGLIAQDVQAVLPEAVRVVDPDKGYLGVAYPSVIPLLVEAIKEQGRVVEEKEYRIAELESHNRQLESRLERVEGLLQSLGQGSQARE